jgi:hypothetical protein
VIVCKLLDEVKAKIQLFRGFFEFPKLLMVTDFCTSLFEGTHSFQLADPEAIYTGHREME